MIRLLNSTICANLTSSNIKDGVNVGGVRGSYKTPINNLQFEQFKGIDGSSDDIQIRGTPSYVFPRIVRMWIGGYPDSSISSIGYALIEGEYIGRVINLSGWRIRITAARRDTSSDKTGVGFEVLAKGSNAHNTYFNGEIISVDM